MKITKVHGREILDSRGQPTLECVLELTGGLQVEASVPSGASVGRYEAKELRDYDPTRYFGKGVRIAIENLERKIAPLLLDKEPDCVQLDQAMINLDGTADKSKLGANTILAASMAIVRAQAVAQGCELYQLINQLYGLDKPAMPRCMFNIINGGLHAESGLAFQEFMIMPAAATVKEAVEVASEMCIALKGLLLQQHGVVAVGDEGGFAPIFVQDGIEREIAALQLLEQAKKQLKSVKIPIDYCLDIASSHFYDPVRQVYTVHEKRFDAQALIDLYLQLCQTYPIVSIEDGLGEDDWNGWQLLTQSMGSKIQLVGDDLFVTNVQRIQQGIDRQVANAVLIKLNQVGTVSETLQAIKLCRQAGYKVVVSHRSGETNDSFIADLAVGVG